MRIDAASLMYEVYSLRDVEKEEKKIRRFDALEGTTRSTGQAKIYPPGHLLRLDDERLSRTILNRSFAKNNCTYVALICSGDNSLVLQSKVLNFQYRTFATHSAKVLHFHLVLSLLHHLSS